MDLTERIDRFLNEVAVESPQMKEVTQGHLGPHLLNAYKGNPVHLKKHKKDDYQPENIALGLLSSSGYLEKNCDGYVITVQGRFVVESCKEWG